jgi:hypothetical protein
LHACRSTLEDPHVKQIDLKGEQFCEACLDKLKSKLRERK